MEFLADDCIQLWATPVTTSKTKIRPSVVQKQTESNYKSFLNRGSSKKHPGRDVTQAAFVQNFISREHDAVTL